MSSIPAEVEPPPPPSLAVEPHAPPEAPETAVDAPPEQPTATVAAEDEKSKKRKAPREKKPKTPSHPPYFEMIKEAITALNEKGGSSPYAIAKYMEQNHKHVLPTNFRKILGPQLKNSLSKGKLIKIKASFKLSEVAKKTSMSSSSSTKTRAARANAAAAAKPKEVTTATTKKRKRRSREVSKIENPSTNGQQLPVVPTLGASTRGRRSKRSAPPPKPKQLKSIKLQGGKKAKKVVTSAAA